MLSQSLRPLALLLACWLAATLSPGRVEADCETQLLASDARARDRLGHSAAVDGDTAVVSTFRSGSTGAAYVFVRNETGWTEQAKLTGSGASDEFGHSVAISSDTVVVGAPTDGIAGTGAAYVFVRDGTTWTQQAKLTASDAQGSDFLGWSVAVDGDTAVAGAVFTSNIGAAYVFVRDGTSWSEQAKLTASDAQLGDFLGSSVAVDGDTVVAGAADEDAAGNSSGSAYVFVRGGTSWTQQAKLTADDARVGQQLGWSVAVDGDTAVVGGLGGPSAEAAYVFLRSGTTWAQQAKLTASDPQASAFFGISVGVSGDTATVGAHAESSNGIGAGAAYVLLRSGTSWNRQVKLTASDAQANDLFGTSVAVSGEIAVVGATGDDDGGDRAGAAYVFALDACNAPPSCDAGPDIDAFCDGTVTLPASADDADGDDLTYTWTSNCGATFSPGSNVLNPTVTLGGCGQCELTLTVDDGNGGACMDSAILTIADVRAPLITCPADVTIECTTSSAPADTGTAAAVDGCGAAVSFSDLIVSDGCDGTGAIERTWVAMDACGNSSSCLQVITLVDTTPPALTCPADTTIGCADPPAPADTGTPIVTGDCSAVTIDFSDDCDVPGMVERTWTATDACGNSSSCTQTITLDATTPCPSCGAQEAELTAPDPQANDGFGYSVSVDGDAAVVGVPFDDGSGTNAGTAHAFARTGTSWARLAELTGTDVQPSDLFGHSAGVSGDTAVVGAPRKDGPGVDAGAAYVFIRISNTWTQQAKLVADDAQAHDMFGWSVSVHGDTVVVGAPEEDAGGSNAGAAYVFVRSGTSWFQQAKLVTDDIFTGDKIGMSVSVHADTAVLGAPSEGSNNAGAAYVFWRSGSAWTQQAKLVTNGGTALASNNFGWSVSVSVDTVLVGAPREDDVGVDAGRAHVFVREGTSWPRQAVLTASGPQVFDQFGWSVSLDGDRAVVGVHFDDDAGNNAGAAHAFVRSGTSWALQAELVADDAQAGDELGRSVAVSGDTVIAGAPDEIGTDNGEAAHVFDVSSCNAPPSCDAGADVDVQCDGVTLAGATAADADGGGLTYSWTSDCGATFFPRASVLNPMVTLGAGCEETCTLTLSVEDCHGATCQDDVVLMVDDSVAPVITCPADVTIECGASSGPADTGSATASDDCGTPSVSSSDVVSLDAGSGTGTIERTWTATDACGNSSTCVQIITVADSTPPLITCPSDVTIACGTSSDPADTGSATANDDCGTPTVSSSDVSLGGCSGTGTIERTWTATDACGNSSTCAQTITVADTTPPVISCPADITIACNASSEPSDTGAATADDDCGTPTVSSSDAVSLDDCNGTGTIDRTWTATDACGNSSTCVQTITVADTTPPVISCPAGITIACDASSEPADTGTAAADDDCGTPTVSSSDAVSLDACNGTGAIQRTWTATDACGNSSTCVQTITVADTTPPVTSCPADITIACDASSDPADTGAATAHDDCGTPTVSSSDAVSLDACNGTGAIERTWTATDACGNSSTCVQTITVADTTPPVISCPADITIACDASSDPADTGAATAHDDCGTPTVSSSDAVSLDACNGTGTIERTWTATDACGNSSTCVQTITIADTAPPVISCPADITIACNASSEPADTGAATADGDCGTPTVSSSDAVSLDACNGTGTIERTWTATDACGNSSTCIQTITVEDATPPVISCPSDVTIACDASSDPADTGTATAHDDCGEPGISSSDVVSTDGCSGTITRTWIAADACENSSSCIQTITTVDTEPPVIQCPDDVTVECGQSMPPASTGAATARDDCDPTPAIAWSDAPTGACPTILVRTWTATDACGNTATCMQAITLLDTSPPLLVCPSDITLECGESEGPAVAGAAVVVDACDDSPALSFSDIVTQQGCDGQRLVQRTWTATDACGNASTCTQEIRVEDTAPPTVQCPPGGTFGDVLRALPPFSGEPAVSDACSDVPVVTFTDVETAGDCPEDVTLTRTWSVTDACGNATTCVQVLIMEPCCAPRCETGCGDDDCVDMVCAIDPFCCEQEWDIACVTLAVEHCATCQPPGDCCSEHGTPGCVDPECERLVCDEEPLDPFCCTTAWDSECAEQALGVCAVCMDEPPPVPDDEPCDDCGGLRADVCAALAASGVEPLPAFCDID